MTRICIQATHCGGGAALFIISRRSSDGRTTGDEGGEEEEEGVGGGQTFCATGVGETCALGSGVGRKMRKKTKKKGKRVLVVGDWCNI